MASPVTTVLSHVLEVGHTMRRVDLGLAESDGIAPLASTGFFDVVHLLRPRRDRVADLFVLIRARGRHEAANRSIAQLSMPEMYCCQVRQLVL